jgi:hypothetical protein
MRKKPAKFILRILGHDPTQPGKMFELVRETAMDAPLSAIGVRAIAGGYEVEMLEPLPDLKLLRTIAPMGGICSMFYMLPTASVSIAELTGRLRSG